MKFIIYLRKLITNYWIVKIISVKNDCKYLVSYISGKIKGHWLSLFQRYSPQDMVLNKIKTLENQVQTIQTQVRCHKHHLFLLLILSFFLAREHVRISRMSDEWNEKDRW